MKNKILVYSSLILFITCTLFYVIKRIDQRLRPIPISFNDKLKDNEKEKIIVENGDIKRITRKGKDQIGKIDSGARRTEIIVDDKGNVSIIQKTHGFIFEPGLCTGLNKEGILFGLDSQIYFVRTLGINIGIMGQSTNKLHLEGHIALSYQLPYRIFNNTSGFIGYNTDKDIIIGFRVKF